MSVQDDTEDMEEQPLVRHRSRRVSPGNAESTESGPMVHSPPSSLPLHNIQDNRQYNGDGFPSEEVWNHITLCSCFLKIQL